MDRMKNHVLISAALCLALVGTAQANPRTERALKAASNAMRLGNYAEAYCLIKPLAERDHLDAQFNIGWMYHNGYGLAINDVTAAEWWLKAATGGHVGAQTSLGLLYHRGGLGVKKDLPRAIKLLIEAASAGEDEAQLVLRGLLVHEQRTVLEVAPDLLSQRWDILGTPMTVKVDLANVRRGPGKTHPIVIGLKLNDLVVELVSKGNWVQIFIPSKKEIAWIHDSLLRRASAEEIIKAKNAAGG